MRILAVIPARGGSKSVPRKNIAPIAGRPLLAYTIEEALQVEAITDLVLSTDVEEIAAVGREYGAQVPFIRPAELATDHAQSAPVLIHSLNHMEALRGITYDAVLMLQPTSPLRKAHHIEDSIKMFSRNDCDTVVTVVSVGAHHPFRMKRLIGDRLVNYIDQGFEDMRPRQVLPKVFIRNGAVYLTRRRILVDEGQIVGDNCLGLEMRSEDSVNIDDKLDFKLAEFLIADKAGV